MVPAGQVGGKGGSLCVSTRVSCMCNGLGVCLYCINVVRCPGEADLYFQFKHCIESVNNVVCVCVCVCVCVHVCVLQMT